MLEKKHAIKNIIPSAEDLIALETKPKERLKYWEIEEFFKCPVVGMCLTLSEQKRLLKKTNLPIKEISPFEIHEALVASSESENRISRRVDRHLHRKFGKKAAELLALDAERFLAHFRQADASGDHVAALWATAIHPNLSKSLRRKIFGDIHMGMHWSGEQRSKMNRRLARKREELEDLRQRNKDVARQKRVLQKENELLKQTQSGLEDALANAKRQIKRLMEALTAKAPEPDTAGLEQDHHFLKEELEALYGSYKKQQQQIAALKEKNRQLASQLGWQGEQNRRFRRQARTIIAEMVAKTRCDASCPSFDLCQKRILIVGGMSRMESLYRELIEGSGGIFEYHDGYMKKGARRLEYRLRRADVVLCPVSCNSHAACSMVKSLAKKHKKTVHMLSNASLQAISSAIWGSKADPYVVN